LSCLESFTGLKINYKYIERLYNDSEIKLVLYNVFILLIKDGGGVKGDLAGDGTGYALSVEHHYRTGPQKEGKKYIYFFSLIDLAMGMYVGYGVSYRSEMDAFHKAKAMLLRMGVPINSLRLDKYFSCGKIIQEFGFATILFLIPKKNIVRLVFGLVFLFGWWFWQLIFCCNIFIVISLRVGFCLISGVWGFIWRRRDDRQGVALFSVAFLHNIYVICVNPK
jgi:transposase